MMKKVLAKILAVALVLSLGLSVAACVKPETTEPAINSVKLRYNSADIANNAMAVKLSDGPLTFTAQVDKTGEIDTAVTLTSSNTAVATVDGMKVTLVTTGETNLVLKSTADSTKTHTVKLTVNPDEEPAEPAFTSLTLKRGGTAIADNGILGVAPSEGTVTLTATVVTNQEFNYTVTLSSGNLEVATIGGNLEVATIDGMEITIEDEGEALITATAAATGVTSKIVSFTLVAAEPQTVNLTGATVASIEGLAGTTEVIEADETLIPAGKAFAAWKVTSGDATVMGKTVTFGTETSTIIAIYGYESNIDNIGFSGEGNYDITDVDGFTKISYDRELVANEGVVADVSDNTDSATSNILAFTLQNLGSAVVRIRVDIRSGADNDTNLNNARTTSESGAFGQNIGILPGTVVTFEMPYTTGTAVVGVRFVIDSFYSTPAQKTGTLLISNMAFVQKELIKLDVTSDGAGYDRGLANNGTLLRLRHLNQDQTGKSTPYSIHSGTDSSLTSAGIISFTFTVTNNSSEIARFDVRLRQQAAADTIVQANNLRVEPFETKTFTVNAESNSTAFTANFIRFYFNYGSGQALNGDAYFYNMFTTRA